MDPIFKSPTNNDVVRETSIQTLDVAKETDQDYAVVTYDLTIALKAYSIQAVEIPFFDKLLVMLTNFHIELAFTEPLVYLKMKVKYNSFSIKLTSWLKVKWWGLSRGSSTTDAQGSMNYLQMFWTVSPVHAWIQIRYNSINDVYNTFGSKASIIIPIMKLSPNTCNYMKTTFSRLWMEILCQKLSCGLFTSSWSIASIESCRAV